MPPWIQKGHFGTEGWHRQISPIGASPENWSPAMRHKQATWADKFTHVCCWGMLASFQRTTIFLPINIWICILGISNSEDLWMDNWK